MLRSPVLPEILSLDPEGDAWRITYLSGRFDFPFDTVRALELALFRTFAVPSIGALLARTGEFLERAQKRYDDTDLLLSEIVEHGLDAPRGRAALERMNAIHARFPISNEDYLYVLSTFIYVPIRWIDAFGWRPLVEKERLAYFHFWSAVGRAMGIRDIPRDFETFDRWALDFERRRFRQNEASRRVGLAVMDMFLSGVPRALHGLGRGMMFALMDDPLREAFGFPRPPRWAISPALLRTRARALRFWPRRTRPLLRTRLGRPTYPGRRYEIEKLGPA